MSAWDDRLQARLDDAVAALWHDVRPGIDGAALDAALADAADGGKRVRPRLVAEVHDGLGGRRPDAVLGAATAVELLHTAFVVHDDLIDGDDLRRGRPSVPGRFRQAARVQQASEHGAAAYATAGAVLVGDLALSAALRTIALLDVPPAVSRRVLDRVTAALATSAAGELADVRFSLGAVQPMPEDAVELAYRKTAAYSFVLPMQLGAMLADADDEVVDRLGSAGRCLGIAFQLHDDLAGMFGATEETGKDPLADLREGKVTLLACHARAAGAWPRLEPHWGDPAVTADDALVVRRVLEECGSRAHVEDVAREHLEAGLAEAERAGVGGIAAGWVTGLLGRRTEAAA